MKGLYEMLEGFDEKGFEEWRMEKDKRKKLLSEKEVMDAIAQEAAEAANAVFEEENRGAVMIRMVIKMNSLIEKLFHEEPQEEKEPDAKFDDLKHRLFAHAAECRLPIQNATLRIAEIRRSAKYLGLLDLISDAGLQEEYDAWKEEHGYE